MKQRIGLFLALLMLLSLFAACGESKQNASADQGNAADAADPGANPTAETEGEEETFTAASTLAVQNYEGRDYRMISTNQDNRQVDIVAEELTGSTLNDLVFNRNVKVADTYNVKMSAEGADFGSINAMVTKDATSGDMSYDLYLTNYTANSLAPKGYLYDFYELPAVDLENPWWDQNEKKDLSIIGKLFLAIGDISPTELLTSECLLFNKTLFTNDGIEYPYADAFEGTWTIDRCYSIANGLTRDLNGDGKIAVDDDLFSITCWYDYGTAALYGAGADFSHIGGDGYVVLDIDLDKTVSIYEKLYQLFIGTEANYEQGEHERSFRVFSEGRAYFCGITFQKIELFLREMENDYGVLPNPKYDEQQANYSTCVSGAGSMVVVPVSCSDPAFVGTMMEAMAAYSFDMITPDLIKVLASTRNVRDQESSEIVQLIIRSRNFDTARNFDVDVDSFCYQMLEQKKTDVASLFAKNERMWKKKLETLNKNFAKLAAGGQG